MQDYFKKNFSDFSFLSITNQLYIEDLYKKFLKKPTSIDNSWVLFFNNLTSMSSFTNKIILNENNLTNYFNEYKIFDLINSFRCFGYENANLDPINLFKKKIIPNLDLDYYNFNDINLKKKINLKNFSVNLNLLNILDIYKKLKKIYCSSIGFEFMHIKNSKEKNWIQNYLECTKNIISFNSFEKKNILNELISAEGIENYLSSKFPGAKRFSLEGGEALIPMLKEIIRYSSSFTNIREIIIGMAHRGRLNVLINILGKNFTDLFNEFSGKYKHNFGSGDVKYHQGFLSDIKINNNIMRLMLAFNPSHLEIVSPVVMGLSRARIDNLSKSNNNYELLPITLHGDASICGQGVIQETLNMSKVPCYNVGGTIRIIINNQIGFTTSKKEESRSSFYCTDIAKFIDSPIFHVNADDVESACYVIRVALAYRNIFKKDVFIDLICYRRHGHNEADDPSVTQPLMYKKIKKHPTLVKIYSDYLLKKNIITVNNLNKLVNDFRFILNKGNYLIQEYYKIITDLNIKPINIININKDRLKLLANIISNIPNDMEIHSRVKKIYLNRKLMANEQKLFDWGMAEMLAYATLLDNGVSIRLSGEDTERGTFFHRHSVLYDQNENISYIPLSNIHINQGNFQVWNSVLSEESSLAFEYGYSVINSHMLVIWEAQFGDFANGAQIVIDQFISSGEQKWNQMSGIVMLLPHGYEGQGPEHSSSRLERYLQLCAENNIQICIPSTPAQIYHILRRQIIKNIRRPLIIMSPKSLLRHASAVSSFNDFIYNDFRTILVDVNKNNINIVKKIVLCCGKIYYDLLEKQNTKNNNIIIIRIEQLYPFPLNHLRKILLQYLHVNCFIWCQEEPKNQGAWFWIKDYILKIISSSSILSYVGRPSSAATSVGCFSLHQLQQKKIIAEIFNNN